MQEVQITAVEEVGWRAKEKKKHGVASWGCSAASAASCSGQRFNLSLPRNGILDWALGPARNTTWAHQSQPHYTHPHVTWTAPAFT